MADEQLSSYSSSSNVEQDFSQEIKILQVADFWESLAYNPRCFPRADKHVKNAGINTMEPMDGKVLSSCLSTLSTHVRTKLGLDESSEIEFFDTRNTAPKDHPNGTTCRPDIVATRQRGGIYWTGVEATVSSGETVEGAGIQSALHSTFLLQARPDLLAVQGFCVTKAGIMLSITSSNGVKRTEALDMSVRAYRVLLYAFITRLYDPDPDMIDPTIKRRWDDTAPEPHYVFDITLNPVDHNPVVCLGYRAVYARESLAQRTHIFANEANPARYDGVPIPVIKDAYCDQNNCSIEDEIINHVHSKGDVPGIIRSAYSEIVCYEGPDRRAIVRDGCQKTRLCLTELGTSVMECKTVKDVLIMMYDLLESTRVVHRNCHALHRDISTGNIMFRDLVVPPPSEGRVKVQYNWNESKNAEADSDDTNDPPAVFCGATYLLGESDDRSFTKNLLIDWERAEILNQKQDEQRLPLTGTTSFMARVIRAGRLMGDLICPIFYRIPDVFSSAAQKYRAAYPDRVKRFTGHVSDHDHMSGLARYPSHISPHHALRHDAESAYWVLVWWAVRAAPEGKVSSPVEASLWNHLTCDDRDQRPATIEEGELHPSYDGLRSLLNILASYLANDPHWATEDPFDHPEYLHEVFQRRILNFLVEKKNENFMLLPLSKKPREPEIFNYAEYRQSRTEYLHDSSTTEIGNSLKRPASSHGEVEKSKKAKMSVTSSLTDVTKRYNLRRRG